MESDIEHRKRLRGAITKIKEGMKELDTAIISSEELLKSLHEKYLRREKEISEVKKQETEIGRERSKTSERLSILRGKEQTLSDKEKEEKTQLEEKLEKQKISSWDTLADAALKDQEKESLVSLDEKIAQVEERLKYQKQNRVGLKSGLNELEGQLPKNNIARIVQSAYSKLREVKKNLKELREKKPAVMKELAKRKERIKEDARWWLRHRRLDGVNMIKRTKKRVQEGLGGLNKKKASEKEQEKPRPQV